MPELPNVTPEMRELMDETKAMLAEGKMVPDPIPWWWDGRRENEPTPEYLGRVLDELPAPDLAERARMGEFDDYHAPADVADGFELIRLGAELRVHAREHPLLADRAAAVENALRRGEFDATRAESDRWVASKDGQETFGALVASARESRPKVGRNDPCPCGSGLKWKRCHGA